MQKMYFCVIILFVRISLTSVIITLCLNFLFLLLQVLAPLRNTFNRLLKSTGKNASVSKWENNQFLFLKGSQIKLVRHASVEK